MSEQECTRPPEGWRCTRGQHEGPCAASPAAPADEYTVVSGHLCAVSRECTCGGTALPGVCQPGCGVEPVAPMAEVLAALDEYHARRRAAAVPPPARRRRGGGAVAG